MALKDLTVASVNEAIDEFDRLQRTAFLKRYGFKEARGYLLQRDGRVYDSKAIAGAAHGYLPGQSALGAKDFSGGRAAVQKTLENLGFTVIGPQVGDMPSPGDVLTNEEISWQFAVGNMGGMRRSMNGNLLVLISDPFKGLYEDCWDGDILKYTGMGQTGDQRLDHAQNRTLVESSNTGISVHLLEALERQRYTYVGEVELAGEPYQETQTDEAGHARLVWMFPLRPKASAVKPVLTETQARAIEAAQGRLAHDLLDAELKLRAMQASSKPAHRTAQTEIYVRNAAVAEYTKRLAKGSRVPSSRLLSGGP